VADASLIPEQMQFIVPQAVPDQIEVGERRGNRDFLKPKDAPVETTRLITAAMWARHAHVLKALHAYRLVHEYEFLPLLDQSRNLTLFRDGALNKRLLTEQQDRQKIVDVGAASA